MHLSGNTLLTKNQVVSAAGQKAFLHIVTIITCKSLVSGVASLETAKGRHPLGSELTH